jgi:hypothetical protein
MSDCAVAQNSSVQLAQGLKGLASNVQRVKAVQEKNTREIERTLSIIEQTLSKAKMQGAALDASL